MRIQTGNAVSGDDFYKREYLIDQTWDLIESGHHILIAAPRRVGKTSLMYYLRDNPKENFTFLYLDIESINNENEFFRRIVNKVLKTDFIKGSQKVLAFLETHKPTIKKVGPDGVEFGVSEVHDYLDMLTRILKSTACEEKKLVIMLDEIPETLENIIDDEGENKGRHFLQSNRELRHDRELCNHVQFIYTGSIGLENVVSKLNAMQTINDLARLKIPPLQPAEAVELIELLLKNLPFKLTKSLIDYILQKIEWLIPFYIQLVIQELKFLYRDEKLKTITKNIIDQAFSKMLEQRNHFENWHTRLRKALKAANDYNFVKELLNIASENDTITSNEIFNLAVKYGLESSHKDLVGSLIYDGYINNHDDEHIYRYNSPILRMWWRKNVAN
ncbi:ATP-binding protein [candidate division KSB1 bacterium]|nr:ATP-binding protein [candidate division KSB1 bacterium]